MPIVLSHGYLSISCSRTHYIWWIGIGRYGTDIPFDTEFQGLPDSAIHFTEQLICEKNYWA